MIQASNSIRATITSVFPALTRACGCFAPRAAVKAPSRAASLRMCMPAGSRSLCQFPTGSTDIPRASPLERPT